jgi:phospholipase C
MRIDRRTFVRGALGATGAVLLGQGLDDETDPAAAASLSDLSRPLPDPTRSGIEHVVVVMMENRSFDHFLGWLPYADGVQRGLSYADPSGQLHRAFKQNQFDGCGFNDPDHSYGGGRIQYNDGRMDGFLADTANDEYAIGYYTHADRPFMGTLARHYITCDRYFCSILGPTYPNRFFHHAGQTDRLDNTLTVSTLPTIWDQLNLAGGPTGHYYYSDVPFLALWGGKYASISSQIPQFLADAAAGTLPNVAYVDPGFIGEGNGVSDDDHPLADIRAGDAFLSQLFHAVSTGPAWDRTVFIINYDEWGGFFEHVAPPRVTAGVAIGASPSSGVDQDLDANGHVLLGFRVPCIVASPFTKVTTGVRPIAHQLFDHTSVLKLIEWRWGLRPLTQRDASTASTDPSNLARVLHFHRPDTSVAAAIPDLPPFVPTACSPPQSGAATGASASPPSADNETWTALQHSELMRSWREADGGPSRPPARL